MLYYYKFIQSPALMKTTLILAVLSFIQQYFPREFEITSMGVETPPSIIEFVLCDIYL